MASPRRSHPRRFAPTSGAIALIALASIASGAQAPAARPARLPAPASILGFEPGADRHLPSWKQITDYFTALGNASPRVQVHVLGKTGLGRPFLAVFISDSATIARLAHYREIQRRLMDPRLRAPGERQTLIDEGKNVILVTSVIHSNEPGGYTTPIVFSDRLARATKATDPEAMEILANTILIVVPSQNPDGVDIVGDYYRSTLGTPQEGSDPPDLYNKYTGHDDNRDWYAFTQVETRYTIYSLYTPWDPEIVNDLHQQASNEGRIFIPPYLNPIEPNIDPILTATTNGLGLSIVARMTSEGFTGIASNASYDEWSPAREYSLYHRGARLLTETASARLATPIDLTFDQLRPGIGYDPRVVSWNFPSLWTGGHWSYGDIVRYQEAASWALFVQAAETRRDWLESYATIADRAMGPLPAWGRDAWPSAIVIPKTQRDTQALDRLVWTLQHGQVEVRESTAPVTVDGASYPAGSYVVLTQQPFGGYAKALLERQQYPDLFQYPGGPPQRPYDVTAHTLPLLFGVDVAHVMGAAPAATAKPISAVSEPPFVSPLTGKAARRIAIYRPSRTEPIDEGWTRWVFDAYKIPFTTITERDVALGNLNERFDVIVFPDGSGNLAGGGGGRGGRGTPGAVVGAPPAPPASAPGGPSPLLAFVDNGGTVLAFNNATAAVISLFQLPVRNALPAGGGRGSGGGGGGGATTDFYCPGSILAVDLDRQSPVAKYFTATTPAVWFEGSPAFDVTDSANVAVVARYPATGNPLLSGWLLGPQHLAGKAALIDARRGKGHVVLFGFRPQYRGQPNATFPLMWGAILEGAG